LTVFIYEKFYQREVSFWCGDLKVYEIKKGITPSEIGVMPFE